LRLNKPPPAYLAGQVYFRIYSRFGQQKTINKLSKKERKATSDDKAGGKTRAGIMPGQKRYCS